MSRLRTAALVGNPNAGKSALFNALTGARQKIANYPGVTVERKEGHVTTPEGREIPGNRGAPWPKVLRDAEVIRAYLGDDDA